MRSDQASGADARDGTRQMGLTAVLLSAACMGLAGCGKETNPQANLEPSPVDLAVSQTVADATPGVGELTEFTIRIRNNGPGTVTDIVGDDSLSPGMTYDSHTAPVGRFNSTTLNWTIDELDEDEEVTMTLFARPSAGSGGSTQANDMVVRVPASLFVDTLGANDRHTLPVNVNTDPPPPPPPPPPPSAAFANEPAGFVARSDWHWQAHNGGGWSYEGMNPFTHSFQSIVNTGYGELPPSGGANVLQATYLAGVAGGFGPGRTNFNFPGGANEVFVGMWHKFPADYIASDNSNKMWFFFIGNERAFLGYRDLPNNNPRRNYGLSIDGFGPTPGVSILGNPAVLIPEGEWYKIEWHVKRNDTGTSNGFMRVWINGVQTHNVTNLTFPGSMSTYYVEGVHNGLNNTAGDRVIPEQMNWWLARVKISTPP